MSNPVFWEKIDCEDDGMPIPMLRANVANRVMDEQKNIVALAHPYYEDSNSKFG